MFRPLPTLGLLPVLAVSVAVAGEAQAQDAARSENLGTITLQAGGQGGEAATQYRVTEGSSEKLTAPLLDTPRTIRVVTQRQIEERGATSVDDILRTTPGVTLGTGEGGTPYGTRPYIRGFEAAFAMAVDGVRSRGRSTYEAFNIETVEVNLGSDGVTTGAGAGGGSINLNTKNATLGETFHSATATIGNGDKRRLTYDGNLAINDHMAFRLNLLAQDSGVAGSPYAEDDKLGIAPAFTWELNSQTKLSFKGQYVKSEGVSDHRVPMANAAWLAGGIAGAPGYAPFGSGTKDDPFLPIETMSRDAYYGVIGRDMRESVNTSVSLRLDHTFNDSLRMTSQLSYLETDAQSIIARPSVSYDAGTNSYIVNRNGNGGVRSQNRGSETLAFNTNFSTEFSLGATEHSLAFGIEAVRDRIASGGSPVVVTTPNGTSLLNPNPNDPFTMTGSFGRQAKVAQVDSTALYVFDTMTLSENWKVSAGLRVEDFKVQNYGAGAVAWSDTLVDYQLGVIYKPRADLSIYASYNTTSTPPGACEGQGGSQCPSDSLDPATAATEAEKTKNIELGVKWDTMGGDLSFAAALYRNEKDNQRVEGSTPGSYEMVGNSRGQGVDLSVMGRVNDRWEIVAGYSYLDAKLVDGGPTSNDNGNRPVNTAEHTFSLWTSYEVNDQLTVGGGANYVSQKYVNTANTAAMPAYWRVDAMASYAVSENTSMQFNINNLFDERYYDSSHVGSFATLQPGRAVSMTLSHKF